MAPAPVTAFFVPGASPGDQTERAYDELRSYAEARTGRSAQRARIFALSCRRDGADSTAYVGQADPCGGLTVHAIFATSDGYTIVWRDGHADVTRRQTYEAIEFD